MKSRTRQNIRRINRAKSRRHNITAGELRERFGLQAQYSAEVTDEQVAAMDAKRFEPGD